MIDHKRGSSSVPEGWKSTRLEEIAQIKSGGTPSRAQGERYFDANGTPWVKTMDLNNGYIDETDESITDYALRESACSVFPQGSVLVAMYGGYNQIGRTGLLRVDAAVNQAISALQISPNDATSEYVLHWLNTHVDVWKQFAASSRKDPNITRKDVCDFPILLPPLEEQRKIAAILSAWDEAIEQQTRLVELKRESKRGLMQQLLTGRVRFKEFTGLEWRKVTFDDVLKLEIGGTPARKEPKYWDSERNTENHWLSIADLKGKNVLSTKERITDLGARKSNTKLIPAGSLVMSFKLTIGRRAILGLPMYTNEAICALIPKDSRVVDVEFLYQYLEVVDFEQSIDQAVKGKTLNKEKIRLLRLSLPTIEEQQKIATVLSATDAELETLTAQLSALKTQKRGLMQRLLTGKTRVQVA